MDFKYIVILLHGFFNYPSGSGETRTSNNIIKGNTISGAYGLRLYSIKTHLVWNNIIYGYTDSVSNAIRLEDAGTLYAYNNTFYNCGSGLRRSAGSLTAKNNISYNNTDNYSGTFDASSTNNLSGPQQTDAPGSNPRNGPDMFVIFVNESSDDFHLASNDAGARNYGTSLAGDGNLAFNDDIGGNQRVGGKWDIGVP